MEAIRVERRDGRVTITRDRPAKKNAIDAGMWSELDRRFAEVAADSADRSSPSSRRCASSATSCCGSSACRSRRSRWWTASAPAWRSGSRSRATWCSRATARAARCQHITHASKDVREGIAAFLERREPRFSGC